MAQGPNWQGSGKEIGTANKVKKKLQKTQKQQNRTLGKGLWHSA